MFTQGQITFAILFALGFIGLMIYSYRKDGKLHKTHYKNTSIKAGIAIFLVLVLFFLIRFGNL